MQRVDSLEKTLMLGGIGGREKGTTEDEMAGWHHWLDGHESEWTLGVGDGQGGLACCDSWGCKESDMTERLIWSEFYLVLINFTNNNGGKCSQNKLADNNQKLVFVNGSPYLPDFAPWEGKIRQDLDKQHGNSAPKNTAPVNCATTQFPHEERSRICVIDWLLKDCSAGQFKSTKIS